MCTVSTESRFRTTALTRPRLFQAYKYGQNSLVHLKQGNRPLDPSLVRLAVWDTVNAVDLLRDFQYPGAQRVAQGVYGRQVVALDEKRGSFQPEVSLFISQVGAN